jgi:hypothetical protein
MSSSASSHDTRSKSPEAVRRSGCVTRSSSSCTPGNAIPFGHAYPADSGWPGSGRSFTTRSPSTVATIPQFASQIRQ